MTANDNESGAVEASVEGPVPVYASDEHRLLAKADRVATLALNEADGDHELAMALADRAVALLIGRHPNAIHFTPSDEEPF